MVSRFYEDEEECWCEMYDGAIFPEFNSCEDYEKKEGAKI